MTKTPYVCLSANELFNPDSEIHRQVMESLPDENALKSSRNDEKIKNDMETGKSILEELKVPKRLNKQGSELDFAGAWGEKYKFITSRVGSGMTIIIRGEPGVGKTQLAVAIMKWAAMAKHIKSVFTDVFEIKDRLNAIHQNRDKNGETEESVTNSFVKIPLLVIDEYDLIPETDTSYCNDRLYVILKRRYHAMRDTILTSNRTRKDLETDSHKWATQVRSMIRENGGVIDCEGWKNWRNK